MSDHPKNVSRRDFLKKAAGGAAVAGLAVSAPELLKGVGDALTSTAAGASPGADPTKPLVAYVRDPSKGEVVVMLGTKEVVRVDPGLATRLFVAASG